MYGYYNEKASLFLSMISTMASYNFHPSTELFCSEPLKLAIKWSKTLGYVLH